MKILGIVIVFLVIVFYFAFIFTLAKDAPQMPEEYDDYPRDIGAD